MKKIYNYENCRVTIHIPEDTEFQERLRKASENFMRKVINERIEGNGNSNTSGDFREKQILHR
jgi:hypothetical protein